MSLAERENPTNASVAEASFWHDLFDSIGLLVRNGIKAAAAGVTEKLEKLGQITKLFAKIIKRLPWFFHNPSITFQQIIRIGVSSLPLIIVISFFVGAVTAISANYQFRGFVPATYLGTAVCKSVIIETGPVLTALVLAGRIGSAIAAEIGTMKEKEELDAMLVLNLDPLRYLAMPRFLSAIIVFPALVMISDFLAIVGGWLISLLTLNITTSTYIFGLRFLFSPYDIWISLTKALFFGIIVSIMGYFQGLEAAAGAKGVGQATMKSVVYSCVFILIIDFFIVYIAY